MSRSSADDDGRPSTPESVSLELGRAPTALAPLPNAVPADEGPPTVLSPPPDEARADERTINTPRGEPRRGAAVPDPERYRALRVIGAGGMGEIRLLRDVRIGRDVACKRVLSDHAGSEFTGRFLREARVQAQLEHPSVVPVYDLGTLPDGSLYFTMQRVRGQTLAEIIAGLYRKDPVQTVRYSRRKLLDTFARVCLAVHYAHARGVVHRDLKPANVMLGDFGEVYVLDWGVAKVLGSAPETAENAWSEPTAPGTMVGSMGFMAPEQVRGDVDAIDARADVYALGVILFELLALEPLHRTTRLSEIASSTLAGIDARPSLREPGVPAELDAVCVRATALDPAARFQSARELGEAVERFLDGDRDARTTRTLAAVHAASGQRAFERARDADPESAATARSEALREALAALALEPEMPEARSLLLELLVAAPERLPAAARSELEEHAQQVRAAGVRQSYHAILSYLVCVPFMLAVGVRNWLVAGIGMASIALAAFATYRISRAPRVSRLEGFSALGFTAVAMALTSTWLGPFVLLPTMSAVSTMMFGLHASRHERWIVCGLCATMVLATFGLDIAGVVDPGFVFRGDHIEILPRAVNLPRGLTLFGLVYSSVAFSVFPALVMGGVRDALSAAERRLFAQAWHVRQLLAAKT